VRYQGFGSGHALLEAAGHFAPTRTLHARVRHFAHRAPGLRHAAARDRL